MHPLCRRPMKTPMIPRLMLALLFGTLSAYAASPPVVSNVRAAQRTGSKLVDIYYDVTDVDGGTELIQMQVSGDGGLTYTIPCVTLSGDVGSGVTLGTNKHIVWNAGVDWNGQFVASTKVRVAASDGTFPPPPPGMAYIPAGPFQMGDGTSTGTTDELPLRQISLSAFFMDRTEVSNQMWLQVQGWATAHGYVMATWGSDSGYADVSQPLNPVLSNTWYNIIAASLN